MLYSNEIKEIPEEMNKLTNLQELRLEKNQIQKIENIDKLGELRYLFLGNNMIKIVPKSIFLNNKLTTLYINDNQIKYLCDEIGFIYGLSGFSIANNKITELPVQLGNLTRLIVFEYDNQKIDWILKNTNFKNVIDYLRFLWLDRLKEDSEKIWAPWKHVWFKKSLKSIVLLIMLIRSKGVSPKKQLSLTFFQSFPKPVIYLIFQYLSTHHKMKNKIK